MTKRMLIAAGCLMLAVAIGLLWLLPAPNPEGSSAPATSLSTWFSNPTTRVTMPSSSATIPTTAPTTTAPPTTLPTIPTTQPTVPTEPSTTLPPRAGQVRLYTCDRARLGAYAQLAVRYYQATDIEVILLTPQAEETCREALARYMAEDDPPTMFCIHEVQDLEKWQHLLFDMNGTAAARQMYSADFGMYVDSRMLALPVAVDWFGYVYNKEKLGTLAFSRDDLADYSAMEYITQYITSQNGTTNVYPFAKPDFSDVSASGLAAMLRTAFADEAQLRSVVDLYIGNSYSTADPMTAFLNEKVVFYPGSTACLGNVLQLGIHKLELLQIYADGRDGMTYFSNYFWCVNATGYSPDVVETLAFFSWVVVSQNGQPAPIDLLGLLSPYQDAAVADNALEKLLRKYMKEEPAVLRWDAPLPEDHAAFCAALAAYYKNPSDTAWETVKQYLG